MEKQFKSTVENYAGIISHVCVVGHSVHTKDFVSAINKQIKKK